MAATLINSPATTYPAPATDTPATHRVPRVPRVPRVAHNARPRTGFDMRLPVRAVLTTGEVAARYAVVALFTCAALWLAATATLRPWSIHWGATVGEARGNMIGDALIGSPQYETTRAITINAPPDEVFPWLMQIGADRGGFYSYEALEDLFGLGIDNTDRLHPEWQDLREGSEVRLAAAGGPVMRVAELHAPFAIALLTRVNTVSGTEFTKDQPLPAHYVMTSWAFEVRPLPDNQSRLVVRYRMAFEPGLVNAVAYRELLGPIHFVMERAMLKGIKARADRATTTSTALIADRTAR